MTHTPAHLDDETLSALADEQLAPEEAVAARAHLQRCADCEERLEGFRSVAALLRRLPAVTPPRNFTLGPRLLVDPPNVVRLRRWYTATRAAAASLAAAFVLLSAGTLYVDSQKPAPSQLTSAARPALAPASGRVSQSAPQAPASTDAARSVAAPAAVPAASPPAAAAAPGGPAGAAAGRPAPLNAQAPDDQQAASTSVSALPPTPTPRALPTAVPAPPAVAAPAIAPADQAVPLRTAAVSVGVLAVVALLIALVVRHRLMRSRIPFQT